MSGFWFLIFKFILIGINKILENFQRKIVLSSLWASTGNASLCSQFTLGHYDTFSTKTKETNFNEKKPEWVSCRTQYSCMFFLLINRKRQFASYMYCYSTTNLSCLTPLYIFIVQILFLYRLSYNISDIYINDFFSTL